MKANLVGFASGVLFGAGLALAQMTDPNKVHNFLDIAGTWDPSLALVMGTAVMVAFVGFRLVLRRPTPRFGSKFELPRKETIDFRLIGGAAVFGAGWGIGGYCPGPAIAVLSLGGADPWVFVAAMLAGAVVGRFGDRPVAALET